MEKKMCVDCHELKMIPENEELCKQCWEIEHRDDE